MLGFFAADGSMLRNNRGAHFIEFHITDRQVLEQIRKVMKSNHKISIRNRNSKWKTIFRLQLGSKSLFQDLSNLGFMQQKSKVLSLPKIPPMYIGAFVRGYFDGDGCVYFRQHVVKGRRTPKWIFQTRFTSGAKGFLQGLHELLKENGISGGFIVRKEGGFELVLSHRDSVALYGLMYNNSPRIYLKRKYKLFTKAVKTLYGE